MLFGKWVRTLKDHTDPLSERDNITSRLINILIIEGDSALDAGMGDEIVQAIKGAKKGGFSAA